MGLMDLKKAELVALAKQYDVAATGTKADLVARLEPVVDWDDPDAEDSTGDSADVDVAAIITDAADMSDDDFVSLAYERILQREADRAGLTHYSACIWFHKTMTREGVCESLLASAEYASL